MCTTEICYPVYLHVDNTRTAQYVFDQVSFVLDYTNVNKKRFKMFAWKTVALNRVLRVDSYSCFNNLVKSRKETSLMKQL